MINFNFLSLFFLSYADAHVCQRCAGTGVQESTPAGVGVFQQEPEQDQEWICSIGTGLEQEWFLTVVFLRFALTILFAFYAICDRS